MKRSICKLLAGAALALSGISVQAQGLEGIIVEDYYTISAADADYLNNTVGVTYPINTGAKVYRIYVDMAPNYKLNTVNGSPLPQGGGNSPSPLDFTTTTTFWNEDGFGTEVPPQTARFDDGAAFDSYITIGVTGRSGGAVGCGANTQHQGVLKTADSNGNLTLCSVYSGFPSGAGTPDGNIPTSPAIPSLTYNLGGLIDFAALQADGNQLVVVGDAWATLPNGTGVDPAGTNRVLIAQLTTDGDLSFHINVQLQQPTGGVLETYVWQNAGAGEVVSPFLTYPQAGTPDCNGVIGGPDVPGTPCNDNNVCTTNDLWSVGCVCAGTPNTTDTDGDGVPNCSDNCPNVAGQIGSACSDGNACTTGDVLNASCVCTGTLNNTDTDGDGIPNCSDNCPNVTGQIGSSCNDGNACTTGDVLNASCVCTGTLNNTDTDGDGIPNCSDNCPNVTGQIGSSCNDNNACTTGDVLNASCVCAGTPDNTDTDGDGIPNCSDNCPNVTGQIGSSCNDGNACTTGDVLNASCVCTGTPNNTDTDGDGVPDCSDNCPSVTGQIGSACNDGSACTTGDVLNASCVCAGTPDNTDTDGDGVPNCSDNCPNVTGQIGSACSDGNACTTGDVLNANCQCVGTLQDSDADGICDANDNCPNLPGVQGDDCDDLDENTSGDIITPNCVCAGTLEEDCLGVPGGPAQPGTTCNDGDVCTTNDVYQANCTCAGTLQDTDGDGTCDANDGCPNDPNKTAAGICGCGVSDVDTDGDATADCIDGCPTDANKIAPGICGCGASDADTDGDGLADCVDNCPNVEGQIGSACDDDDEQTQGDVINANCICEGSPVDCNDNDPCTIDSFNGTACVHTPGPDADGDGTCDLTDGCVNDPNKIAPGICGCGNPEPGTQCDDNDVNTSGDVVTANCECHGTPLGEDCLGVPGGSDLPGTECDDQDETTGDDTWSPNCVCEGLPYDCLEVPGGSDLPGTPCDDGNTETGADTWSANCVCEGLPLDCEDVPGGDALPGTPCDDGNAGTNPDTWSANCVCVGVPTGCTENLTLSLTLDAFGSQTTWTLYDATETNVIDAGGPYTDGAPGVVNEPICVPVGCYHLRVNDTGGNGGSHYVLRDASNRRIIDASLGSFSSASEITGASRSFCVPIINLSLLSNWCDRTDLLIQSPIYCNGYPGASGYQFWLYDPHGTYNRRVLSATNSLVPVTLNTNPVPLNKDLNVRVRPLVNNVYGEFGPVCRVKFRANQTSGFGRDVEFIDAPAPLMSIFPNPNRDGHLTLSMTGLEITAETLVDVDVYDLLGKRVVAEKAIAVEGTINHRMDLAGKLGTGMYMVNVTIDGQLFTQRLVMQ